MPRPVIVNQLGSEVGAALAAHSSRPHVREQEIGNAPWLVGDSDILLTRPHPSWQNAPGVTPPEWPGRLRWVQVASTGVDWFPRWMMQGPLVTCGRGHHAAAIAEYVMTAILLYEKRLDQVSIHSQEAWRRHALGTLEGRTLGLAGYGAIGRAVAIRARAFGMRLAAWRRVDWDNEEPDIIKASSLAELASLSDHLLLALPLTDATRHCVNASVLGVARPGLHLINIARGGLVDQTALLAALDEDHVRFATLDVTDPEPLPAGHPIYTHPRIRLTPHISWSGQDSGKRLTEQILANLTAYTQGGTLNNTVDPIRGY